jgi:hypothetical protein
MGATVKMQVNAFQRTAIAMEFARALIETNFVISIQTVMQASIARERRTGPLDLIARSRTLTTSNALKMKNAPLPPTAGTSLNLIGEIP